MALSIPFSASMLPYHSNLVYCFTPFNSLIFPFEKNSWRPFEGFILQGAECSSLNSQHLTRLGPKFARFPSITGDLHPLKIPTQTDNVYYDLMGCNQTHCTERISGGRILPPSEVNCKWGKGSICKNQEVFLKRYQHQLNYLLLFSLAEIVPWGVICTSERSMIGLLQFTIFTERCEISLVADNLLGYNQGELCLRGNP